MTRFGVLRSGDVGQRGGFAILLCVSALPLWAQAPRANSHPDRLEARLDHVIVVVRDLDSASVPYAQLGFRFKPGRLHPWVEGGPGLERLLAAIGGRNLAAVTLPDGSQGRRWSLTAGTLVVVPRGGEPRRPRPVGVVLETAGEPAPELLVPRQLADGLWLGFVGSGASSQGRALLDSAGH